MAHTILTFITKADPAKIEQLKEILAKIQGDLDGNEYLPFAKVSLVHFASFVILDDDGYGPYLVFENNFDGKLDPYLDELLSVAGDGLHQIYSCCLEYGGGNFDRDRLRAYMKAHVVRPNAYHIGNVGRKAARIRQEQTLREEIEADLDRTVKAGTASDSPSYIASIQRFVTETPALAWATAKIGPRQTFSEWFVPWVNIAITALVALVLLPILIPVVIIWIIILRYHEKQDPGADPPDIEHIQDLVGREDQIVQNQLASLTTVKPGQFRRITLWTVLWIINLAARVLTKGELSGIPSIHFAHWAMIDNGRRLLFLSNFDGSWMGYLDDFIDKAATGLTGVWSNTVGFPTTKFLIKEGARNEAGFKAFARNTQVPTLVWYSAYHKLTVQSVDRDSLIRERLFQPLDDAAAKEYLQLF